MTFEIKPIPPGDVAADYFDYCQHGGTGETVEQDAFLAGVRAAEARIKRQLDDYNAARSYQGGV